MELATTTSRSYLPFLRRSYLQPRQAKDHFEEDGGGGLQQHGFRIGDVLGSGIRNDRPYSVGIKTLRTKLNFDTGTLLSVESPVLLCKEVRVRNQPDS